MNKIFWEDDKIAILTDTLESSNHSHWMPQLFVSLEQPFSITVANQNVLSSCLLVNKNTPHTIHANGSILLSIVIDPASSVLQQILEKDPKRAYWNFTLHNRDTLKQAFHTVIETSSSDTYIAFMKQLYAQLDIVYFQQEALDPRIMKVLHLLNTCDCYHHSIASFAGKVSLSPSRLSHLFKEQLGVPLKSYILLHQIKQAFIRILTGATITDACLQAGFDSPSHFANVVKQNMGVSASSIRKDSVFIEVSNR